MKILYHHRTQAEDGQAVHIRALQRAFREEGHDVREVSLVAQGAGESAGKNGAEAGRSRWGWVTRLPRFARELSEYAYTVPARNLVAKEIARYEPDFVYERYAFGNAGGLWAAGKRKTPFVLEVNSPMVLELQKTRGLSFPRTAERLERNVFCGADRVCVVTGVLGGMLAEMGVDEERLLVTPNGVHLELYRHADPAEARRAARAALGLPEAEQEGEVVLGFVGYTRTWHRLDRAVRALLRPELERGRLLVIGDGPAHEELQALAGELGVADRVHFPGRRPHDEIPALLPSFDIALVPAINPYASPLKLHEYMAASLAVIAPDQPNLREVITPDSDGLLVDPNEDDALVEAIVALASDPAKRSALGAAARATIETRELTWRGNARRVVQAVRELR